MRKKNKSQNPTVDPQAITNRQGTTLVEKWLVKGWIPYPQTPDYHVDWIVEPTDSGELTGLKFCAQQKAKQILPKSKKQTVSIQIKAKHLIYFIEKLQLPVFAFAIDVGSEAGYYLFLQEWIDLNYSLEELRKREQNDSSISVQIPIGNLITDQSAFRAEVERSFLFMKKRYPGEIQDAMALDIKALSKIDPRWNISLDVIAGKKHYQLTPIENMKLSLKAKGAVAKALEELYQYGKPVNAEYSEVSLSGSPLFADKQIRSIRVSPAIIPKAEVEISSTGKNPLRFCLPVKVSRGNAGVMLTGGWPDGPFEMEFKMPTDAPSTNNLKQGTIQCHWLFSRWFDKPILRLPYFQQIHGLSLAIVVNDKITFDWTYEGNSISKGHFGSPNEEDPFFYSAVMVDHIFKLREIATITGCDIRLKEDTWGDKDCLLSKEFTHSLIKTGAYEGDGGAYCGEAHVTPIGAANTPRIELLRRLEENNSPKQISFDRPDQSVRLHGTLIKLGAIRNVLSSAILEASEASKMSFLASQTDSLTVVVRGAPGSCLTMRRLNPDIPVGA